MSFREAYLGAARALADQVDRLPDDGWDEVAFGDWSRRELVGHIGSMQTDLVRALDHRPPRIDLEHRYEYYALRRRVDPAFLAAAVAAAAGALTAAAAALGDSPRHTFRAQVHEAAAALDGVPDDVVVATAAGGMRLREWLPTRTFELVVHSFDLAAATGIPATLPDDSVRATAALAAETATEVGDGELVVRALTGRGGLPSGYSCL